MSNADESKVSVLSRRQILALIRAYEQWDELVVIPPHERQRRITVGVNDNALRVGLGISRMGEELAKLREHFETPHDALTELGFRDGPGLPNIDSIEATANHLAQRVARFTQGLDTAAGGESVSVVFGDPATAPASV